MGQCTSSFHFRLVVILTLNLHPKQSREGLCRPTQALSTTEKGVAKMQHDAPTLIGMISWEMNEIDMLGEQTSF